MRLVEGEGPLEGVLGGEEEGLPDPLPPPMPGDTLLDPEVEGVWELDPPPLVRGYLFAGCSHCQQHWRCVWGSPFAQWHCG